MRSSRDPDRESDEPGTASTLQDLLADLNGSTDSSMTRNNANRTGSGQSTTPGPWLSSPRSSPARQSSLTRPYSYLSRRRSSAPRIVTVSSYDQPAGSVPSPGASSSSSVFQNPNRSIFTSGQPTSSVSANTAHASMSAPPPARESRPLAALSGTAAASRRPTPQAIQPALPQLRHRVAAPAEKDADDPSVAMDEPNPSRRGPRTSAALSQLFVEDSALGSPAVSRHGSYLRTLSGTQFTRIRPFDGGALAPHVYGQGLLSGKFSDITVYAFGTSYNLHRLLLDRAPFFSTAFSGPWLEANSNEMKLDPGDVDPNITQAAFELALKRIYGCEDPQEEDQEAIGLFAVACWLEMGDLLEASIESLLRQMTPARLSTYIRFVTGNYYGTAGSRILASAKAMLCRDGWQMKLRYWDGIPAEIVRDIIGSDGLFVIGEWERWTLAKRILNRRLKHLAPEAGPIDKSQQLRRFQREYRGEAVRRGRIPHSDVPPAATWTSLYFDSDIVPLLQLLDEGIHYAHMSFEELQHIRNERDILGVPIIPEKVISSALWMQMELRQKIVNADDSDLDLGLTQQLDDVDATLLEASSELTSPVSVHQEPDNDDEGKLPGEHSSSMSKEAAISTESASLKDTAHSMVSLAENLRDQDDPQQLVRFWVPTTDATFPVGDCANVTQPRLSVTSGETQTPTGQPEDVQWSGDLTSLADAASESLATTNKMQRQSSGSSASPKIATAPSPPMAYTKFPPFRFSVEFQAASVLKENKRYYSNTIWYAGSLWNVYVQKKESAKGLQLGVYLHREKQAENGDIMLANYAAGHSVDERIGRLERELETRRRGERRAARDGELDATYTNPGADLDTISGMLSRPARRPPKQETHGSKGGSNSSMPLTSFPHLYNNEAYDDFVIDSDPDTDGDEPVRSASLLPSVRSRPKMPALPPYTDGRPTIKTYFKIYTPAKDGRVLTVYESKPDRFNFSQSWGWKSGSLDLESDVGSEEGRDMRDRRLRFMVVLGTV